MTSSTKPSVTQSTQRGFVLIVVLMLLVSLTLIVIAQIRRSSGGQLITSNSSQYALAETAAQTVLRYCEAQFMVSPNMKVTTPGVRGTNAAAWRDPAKWLASQTVPETGVTFPGVANFSCLIEDATSELIPSSLSNDINPETVNVASLCTGAAGVSPTMCKYRVTARVTLSPNNQQMNLQSEIRFGI
jgi:type II secretory pathway pseudopilin PulG